MNTGTILIISNEFDQSTRDVFDWIKHVQPDQHIYLVNLVTDFKFFIELSNDVTVSLEKEEKVFALSDINAFWYRRNPNLPTELNELLRGFEIVDQIKIRKFHFQEFNVVLEFIFSLLVKQNAHVLSSPVKEKSVNKIITLNLAREAGLTIPRTVVTSSPKDYEISLLSQIGISFLSHLVMGYDSK